jgi:hypothetical protein
MDNRQLALILATLHGIGVNMTDKIRPDVDSDKVMRVADSFENYLNWTEEPE